jgi:alkanesulfonate monooxygenase SsuD/methylene tetrahydromethanopterin reductase-like flavin-dependent oxidoreductase (luciferase family)
MPVGGQTRWLGCSRGRPIGGGAVSDYGRSVEFGISLTPNADDYPQLVEQAELADRLGLDYVGAQDHPYQRRFLDSLTLLAALAARTTRVRLFPDVANLPLRPPAVLAKAAASLDVMSGGRFELGLGAGAFWDAIWAMGGPRRSPGEAVEALEEAMAVIRRLWSGERGLRYDGRHYALRGTHSGPLPVHPIGIWLGAGGPRMLSLLGRQADGWIPSSSWLPPERIPEPQARIDESAQAAGRDPATIKRLYNVSGRITTGAFGGFLDGPVDHWVEALTGLALDGGLDTFIFWPQEAPAAQLGRFAEEVVPRVRESVRRDRTTRAAR